MVKLRKAISDDKTKIVSLLLNFNNPEISETHWQRLLDDNWNTNEGYFGFVLEDDEKIVGFMGLLFSKRTIKGKKFKFANITSIIVEENYRTNSMQLIFALNELKECTITNFTAIDGIYKALKRLGFEDLSQSSRLFIPMPSISGIFNPITIELDNVKIKNVLDADNLKIFNDHQQLGCIHLLISHKNHSTYLVIKRKKYLSRLYHTWKTYRLADQLFYSIFKRSILPHKSYFGEILYCSNVTFLTKHYRSILFKVCLKKKLCGLLIDNKYLDEIKLPFSFIVEHSLKRIYKSSELQPLDIDQLYSEEVLL